jgi:hypothetical protein
LAWIAPALSHRSGVIPEHWPNQLSSRWIDLGRASLRDSGFTLPLEAEGIACGEDDDWSVSRIFKSGDQQWEALPRSYGARLVISGVTEMCVRDPASLGEYTLTKIRFEGDTLTIQVFEDTDVTLQVSGIAVLAEATHG